MKLIEASVLAVRSAECGFGTPSAKTGKKWTRRRGARDIIIGRARVKSRPKHHISNGSQYFRKWSRIRL